MFNHPIRAAQTSISEQMRPAAPRRSQQQSTPRGDNSVAARRKPKASENSFDDAVNEMLDTKMREIEDERATRKGARESNARVPSPRRRLRAITVQVRRNNGAPDAKAVSVECKGLT